MPRSPVPVLRAAVALALAGLATCSGTAGLEDGVYAVMKTTRGTITLKLEYERTPLTVASFVGLAEGALGRPEGGRRRPFFDGLAFHRVIPGFMIQSGDPTASGSGGPGYAFPDEIVAELPHDGPGVLSMANSGPNTNGSQFFITHAATPWLDGMHTVFGRVVSGQDVVEAIEEGDTIQSVRIKRLGGAARAYTVSPEGFDAMLEASWTRARQEQADKRARDLELIGSRWPKAIQTPSGLRYEILNSGAGESPTQGAAVTCHYRGELLDGTVFDSSYARGAPTRFEIGKLIAGWDEALLDMKKGERRLLVVPPELAYGEQGYPGVIPPNSFLIFELELIDF